MKAPRLSVGKLLLLSLAFAAVFTGYYVFVREGAATSSAMSNPLVEKVFLEYGYAFGALFGLLFFLKTLILVGLKNILWLSRFVSGNALCSALVSAVFGIFAYWLVFFEPRHTEIARAIIDFAGTPLLAASVTAFVISAAIASLGIVLPSAPKAP